VTDHPDPLRDLGAFIREQRAGARLSLRRLSELAGISNPYLSQIERGLRRPSAEILQQIARGLRISAETLYVQAGILDERSKTGGLAEAILEEPFLGEEQKQTLLHIYRSFLQANEDHAPSGEAAGGTTRRSDSAPRSRAARRRLSPVPEESEAADAGLPGPA
jgi:transcriptional regulator with XRE-family HTH domain